MSVLSNYIIQDLIQNVSKGVTETFKFVLERYNRKHDQLNYRVIPIIGHP